jgi:hypothetical protein
MEDLYDDSRLRDYALLLIINPILNYEGLGNQLMHAQLVYTRERKHIGIRNLRVTCLALPFAATQSLECRALDDSQSRWCLTIATKNKQLQINK